MITSGFCFGFAPLYVGFATFAVAGTNLVAPISTFDEV